MEFMGGGTTPYNANLATLPVLAAAASNDLSGVRWAIEGEGSPLDLQADWYAPVAVGGEERLERKRRTAAMVAAMHGSLDVLGYLLECGADPSAVSDDEEQWTALHCAASGGSAAAVDAVRMLLAYGANRNAVDAFGRSPADVFPGAGGPSDQQLGGSLLTAPQGPSELDNEAYMTDEFRMYEFKVRRCTKTRAHDWTECPFTHPGEKARRRDPRRFNYCGSACPDFRKGSCRRGDSCEYAHGVFECWLHPARYRTQFCKDGINCQRRVCFFAHTAEQLRAPTASGGEQLTGSPPPSPTGPPLSSPPGESPPLGSPRTSTDEHAQRFVGPGFGGAPQADRRSSFDLPREPRFSLDGNSAPFHPRASLDGYAGFQPLVSHPAPAPAPLQHAALEQQLYWGGQDARGRVPPGHCQNPGATPLPGVQEALVLPPPEQLLGAVVDPPPSHAQQHCDVGFREDVGVAHVAHLMKSLCTENMPRQSSFQHLTWIEGVVSE